MASRGPGFLEDAVGLALGDWLTRLAAADGPGGSLHRAVVQPRRPDLLGAGKGNGRHGFIYPIPAELKDGRKHLDAVRIAGTNVDLRGTPRSIEPEVLR